MTPEAAPSTWLQEAWAGLSPKVSLTSCRNMPLQGLLRLQSKFTATGVADDPLMSVNLTSLIFTPES